MSDSWGYKIEDPVKYENLRIIDVLRDIGSGSMVLPPIQRKAVWKEKQITDFFDSILRGYPLNNFLFWRLKKSFVNARKMSLYKFLTVYDQRDNYNEAVGKPLLSGSGDSPKDTSRQAAYDPDTEIIAVLDGQQRLTALNVALQGCLRLKKPYKNEYPEKQLYLVFHPLTETAAEDDEEGAPSGFAGVNPKFQFLSAEEEASLPKEWHRVKVKDIIKYPESEQTKMLRELERNRQFSDDEADVCGLLWQKIRLEKVINACYIQRGETKGDAMSDVLRIFVRINSGGTQLAKTDLLFSTVVSYWDDAREKLEQLDKEIKAEHYEFNTDFYMRACLYVLDISSGLTPEVFEKQDNVQKIQQNWTKIREAITGVIVFLRDTGYSWGAISSWNALLPLIYCRFHGGSAYLSKCQTEFVKYLAVAQLKSLFGRGSNTTLTSIRAAMRADLFTAESKQYFSWDWLLTKLSNQLAAQMTCTEADLEEWFTTDKGSVTFQVLSLLYPRRNDLVYHQDHLHPQSLCQDLDKELRRQSNYLSNLQLLSGPKNQAKSAMQLKDWAQKQRENKQMIDLYFPEDVSLELADCQVFWQARKELMLRQLRSILAIY
ncbi:MAG: DUF262 domain-containing protein [bacterium]|nr:DUF262 domain-containing protein [bacterium]